MIIAGSWATKKKVKNPQKCSLRRDTNVAYLKFRGWRRKKKSARFWSCTPRNFNKFKLIRGQRFWEFIFFTAIDGFFWNHSIYAYSCTLRTCARTCAVCLCVRGWSGKVSASLFRALVDSATVLEWGVILDRGNLVYVASVTSSKIV